MLYFTFDLFLNKINQSFESVFYHFLFCEDENRLGSEFWFFFDSSYQNSKKALLKGVLIPQVLVAEPYEQSCLKVQLQSLTVYPNLGPRPEVFLPKQKHTK